MTKIPSSTHFPVHLLIPVVILSFLQLFHHSNSQPDTYGYTCTPNTTTTKNNYPCQTYVHYLAGAQKQAPYYLDLASVGDLFNLSRLSISTPSNISNPSYNLVPNQPLFIPISCGCNPIQNQTLKALSFANITYKIIKDDTFYFVSTHHFENLTTYQSVEVVNPTLIPENLTIGGDVYFPIFCKCPSDAQRGRMVNYLVSYVFQPNDSLDSIAAKFNVSKQDIVSMNGNDLNSFDTVFVPVNKLPTLNQPMGAPPNVSSNPIIVKKDHKGTVIGLGVGLGICVLALILSIGFLFYRENMFKKRLGGDLERIKKESVVVSGNRSGGGGRGGGGGGKGYLKEMEILADVSDTLDKYKVYEIDELKKCTNDFDQSYVIQGSVYKGTIGGKVVAIKKMKWNAYEELKILQKVNHGNLVMLEGFCIDPEDASCHLVYEYIENGSLYSWIHEKRGKLSWKTRLRSAIDVANGLQYIHEHTTPQVVHKDIKTSNILLDANMRAKIANFGLAKSGCNAITRHIVGTQGYISPEYLSDGVVSPKMDVFSFGVVLLELLSAKEAIDEDGVVLWMNASQLWVGTEEEKGRKVLDWVDKSILEETSSVANLSHVMSVAVACVNKEPSKRPGMVDVVYALCKSDDLFYDLSKHEFSTSPLIAR